MLWTIPVIKEYIFIEDGMRAVWDIYSVDDIHKMMSANMLSDMHMRMEHGFMHHS